MLLSLSVHAVEQTHEDSHISKTVNNEDTIKSQKDLVQGPKNSLFDEAYIEIRKLWDNPALKLTNDRLNAFNALYIPEKKGLISKIFYCDGKPCWKRDIGWKAHWEELALVIAENSLPHARQNATEDWKNLMPQERERYGPNLRALIDQLVPDQRIKDLLQWRENPLFDKTEDAIKEILNKSELSLPSDSFAAFNALTTEQRKGIIRDFWYSKHMTGIDPQSTWGQLATISNGHCCCSPDPRQDAQHFLADLLSKNQVHKDAEPVLQTLIENIHPPAKVVEGFKMTEEPLTALNRGALERLGLL